MEGIDDVDGISEEHAHALLASGVSQCAGEVSFTKTDQAEDDDICMIVDELEAEEILDLKTIDFLGPVPAEGIEGFDDGEASGLDSPGNGTVGMQGGFAFDELGEVVEVSDGVFGGGGSQRPAVLFDKGQVQGIEVGVKGGAIGFHGMLERVVWGEIGGGKFEVEQIAAASEVERTGCRCLALPLLKDVFDILAGVGLTLDGVLYGEGYFFRTVDFRESDDFVNMNAFVEVTLRELLMIVFGVGAHCVEGEQPFGVPSAAALVEEFLDMVGVLEVAVTLVAARMGCHEVMSVIEAESVMEGVEGQLLGCVA